MIRGTVRERLGGELFSKSFPLTVPIYFRYQAFFMAEKGVFTMDTKEMTLIEASADLMRGEVSQRYFIRHIFCALRENTVWLEDADYQRLYDEALDYLIRLNPYSKTPESAKLLCLNGWPMPKTNAISRGFLSQNSTKPRWLPFLKFEKRVGISKTKGQRSKNLCPHFLLISVPQGYSWRNRRWRRQRLP